MGEQPSRQELTDLLDRIERRLTPELDSNDSRIIRVRATDFRIKDGGSLERWYVVPNGFWGRVADEFQRIVTFDDSPDLGIAYSARDNGRLNITTRMRYRNGRALVRTARAELRDQAKDLNSLILAQYLNKYAETGEQYVEVLQKIIKQNNLKDFDDAKLLPNSIELESLI